MKTHFFHALELMREKFWIVPLACLVAAGILAGVSVFVDQQLFGVDAAPLNFMFLFQDAANVRALLSTVGGSVLGVAGVAFSITIASLTLASQTELEQQAQTSEQCEAIRKKVQQIQS